MVGDTGDAGDDTDVDAFDGAALVGGCELGVGDTDASVSVRFVGRTSDMTPSYHPWGDKRLIRGVEDGAGAVGAVFSASVDSSAADTFSVLGVGAAADAASGECAATDAIGT